MQFGSADSEEKVLATFINNRTEGARAHYHNESLGSIRSNVKRKYFVFVSVRMCGLIPQPHITTFLIIFSKNL